MEQLLRPALREMWSHSTLRCLFAARVRRAPLCRAFTAKKLSCRQLAPVLRRRVLRTWLLSAAPAAGTPGGSRESAATNSKPAAVNAPAEANGGSNAASAAARQAAEQEKGAEQVVASMSGLKAFHLAAFFSVLVSGLAFLAMLLYLTADIQWQRACLKVVRRLLKTVAIRQVMGILAAMTFVRFGLEPLVKVLRRLFRAQGVWEKSSEFYILREVRTQSGWGQGAPWSDQRVSS